MPTSQIPSSYLIEGLEGSPLKESRQSAGLLMRGWRYPSLVLKDPARPSSEGAFVLDYEKKRATAILADKCVKNLLYAIWHKGYGGLKHLT